MTWRKHPERKGVREECKQVFAMPMTVDLWPISPGMLAPVCIYGISLRIALQNHAMKGFQ